MRLLSAVFIVALSLISTLPARAERDVSYSKGTVITPNTVITSDDGNIKVASGEIFDSSLFLFRRGCYGVLTFDKMAEQYKIGICNGARAVQISTPHAQQTIYGLLIFYPVEKSLVTSSSMYRIEIPDEYLDKAMHGDIAVVYSTIGMGSGMCEWILWLSNQPLK